MLYQTGLNTDVGIKLYLRPKLNLFLQGAIPTYLIRKSTLISGSRLLEWWSNFINRTDLVRLRVVEPPVKPKKVGNIQIVFLVLPSGMSVSVSISWYLKYMDTFSKYQRLLIAYVCFLGCFLYKRIVKMVRKNTQKIK